VKYYEICGFLLGDQVASVTICGTITKPLDFLMVSVEQSYYVLSYSHFIL